MGARATTRNLLLLAPRLSARYSSSRCSYHQLAELNVLIETDDPVTNILRPTRESYAVRSGSSWLLAQVLHTRNKPTALRSCTSTKACR